jgi:hypothetical protein
MAGKSQAQTDAVLNVLRGTNITAPGSVYVSLFSAAPASDAVDGTELSGNGYARQSITFGAPATDSGGVRKVANTNVITFGPGTSSDWAAATHFGVHSASSGAGNLLYWDALTTPKTVQVGDSGQYAAGALVIKED